MAAVEQYDELVMQINSGTLAPVYLLHGAEGYFIDELLHRFEELIPEGDRDFNLYTFYAPETDPDTIMDACRRYPMMADRQVVIVKEAQSITANQLNRLHLYTQQPSMSTVLVIAHRGEECKASNLIKGIKACKGVIFKSDPYKDKEIGPVISKFIRQKGLTIEGKGLAMLKDFVGTDLSRLYNEIDKLTVALPAGAAVTPEVIERHIGISKDYNTFELVGALARKDARKVFTIIDYMRRDQRKFPTVVLIERIWTFFSDLLVLIYTPDKSDAALCKAIGRNSSRLPPYYEDGLRLYNARMLIEILRAIRTADCRGKGVGSRMDSFDILNDLAYRILTARGVI